jgi:hypothetical protein
VQQLVELLMAQTVCLLDQYDAVHLAHKLKSTPSTLVPAELPKLSASGNALLQSAAAAQ